MSSWRAAKCLTALIKQVNTAYPDRPRESDGLIGDQAHASRKSSHNPDSHGVVRGWDCTTDHHFTDTLAEQLRLLGKAGDPRVLYVIYQRRIASSRDGWAWRTYTASDPHTSHIHLSVSDDPAIYDRTGTWPVLDRVKAQTASKPTPTTPAWYTKPHKIGDRDQEVASIRKRLKLTAGVTFDKRLDAAVRYVQKAHKLPVDGIVGPATARAIG